MPPPSAKFHLTASALKSHFKLRCERRFRWETVPTSARGRPGIGWNVPRVARSHSRPGIALLMQAGDTFEIEQIQALSSNITAEPALPGIEQRLHHAGIEQVRERNRVRETPIAEALDLFRQMPAPRFVAQVDIDMAVHLTVGPRFLQGFGLDPDAIDLGPARPDLIELLPPDNSHPLRRLRVWDFKSSQVARHEHFIQVAYYSLLLEVVLAELGITDLMVDTVEGVVAARDTETASGSGVPLEHKPFKLEPYRLAVVDFLRNRVPDLLAMKASEAHFHVQDGCMMCEYMEECRGQANAASDLSRIPFMSSESKRHLLAEGFRSHPDLATLDAAADRPRIEQLRALSHDLATNGARYIALAQALEDGSPRLLEKSTFQMPRWENVRIVLSAEQDAVTGTCFALGIKAFAWDEANNKPLNQEHVFVAETKGDEVSTLLLPFLQTLNRLLEEVHQANAAIRGAPVDDDPRVVAADQQHAAAQAALDEFKSANAAGLRKRNAEADALRAQRAQLDQTAKTAERAAKEIRSTIIKEQRRAQKTLHFYIYDSLDVLALKGLIERHLFDSEPPELLTELSNLIRLFPPESVLPDAETFRTIPATIVVQMLRTLVALPVPYTYDLRTVSELYGVERGFRFRTPYGFSWEYSNQIAFERIHDFWKGNSFTYQSRGSERTLEPAEILDEIRRGVLTKLRATDSVIRRLKEDMGERLLLRKEPFQLFTGAEPLAVPDLEKLRVFTTLEVSLDELDTKRTHTLPVADRVAGFVCIHGLRAETTTPDAEGCLWFTFDPSASDTKFEAGNFNLVLTPEDDPSVLLSEIDGELFTTSWNWRLDAYKVTLKELDLLASPPRVRLEPAKLGTFMKKFDPARSYVLDEVFIDYNSSKVFDVLGRLAANTGSEAHIQALLAEGTLAGWAPFIDDIPALEADLRVCLSAAGADPDSLLNRGQWRAWRGVMAEPLTLVWGPPGTGKTHTVAHMLVGYALAARRLGRPIRVLVTAFTHHAINNVLEKLARVAADYRLGAGDLQIGKLQRNAVSAPDTSLPTGVLPIDTEGFANTLASAVPCQVIGATVWAVHRAMTGAGDVVQPWFDVILVDEASQLKLPDALIAFASSKPCANIILAGDDRQLPPIIKGAYPEMHAPLLTSVFAFVRAQIDRQHDTRPDLEARILFQLEDNFRMNELLTAYPRDVLYRGRFFATRPDIRITSAVPLARATSDLLEFLLHPDRPVLLVRYRPPRTYTARNPLEAELAARILNRLRDLLVDGESGAIYTPQRFASQGAAVLAPHRAQNSTIRQLLRNYGFGTETQPMPLVDTVDKLQGQERDVVVMSYGVADTEYAEGEAEFLLSSNRFNVAATRARHKLIVLCADTVLDLVPADQEILYDAMMLKEFRRYCDSGQREMVWMTGDGQTVTFQVQWKEFPL